MADQSTTSESPRTRLQRRTKRLLQLVVVVAALVLVLNLAAWFFEPKAGPEPNAEDDAANSNEPLPKTFDGPSSKLVKTEIVPALESPLAAGKSAIWCGALGLAWQQFQDKITKGPIRLQGVDKIADMLNREPRAALEPEHYYVAGGWYKDGILDQIRRELPARFPNAPLPPEPEAPPSLQSGLGYAYLEVMLKYQFQFKKSDEPLQFKDGDGKTTPVKSFGVRAQDKGDAGFRSQVRVLFRERNEFAVDLSVGSKPYQVVLARIPLKATLKETLDELDRRSRASQALPLTDASVLLVPTMSWRADHRYRELEGRDKLFQNPGFELHYFEAVEQMMDFQMDHRGVVLKVMARVSGEFLNGHDETALPPDHFIFDRPYLLVLKKRDGRPFFIMWVANAELLYPW